MVKKGLPAKRSTDWRSEGGGGISLVGTWGNSTPAVGQADAVAMSTGYLRISLKLVKWI